MNIAVIGAGFMGYGIALNLLKNKHAVRVIAHRNRAKVEKLVTHGAIEVASYEDLLRQADAVVSCVSTAEQLEKVVDQAEPFLETVTLWLDTTTSRPEVAEKIALRLIARGVDFADAPVTRGPGDAEAGRLVSLVGASPEVYERACPLLACYSETIIHLGPVGSGLRAKLINNFITMGQVALVIEAFKAADRYGIDRRTLYHLLMQGAANSGTLKKMVGPALEGDYGGHTFSLGNGAKDVFYGSEMHAGSETGEVLSAALSKYYRAQLRHHSDTVLLSELLKPA
ncbi:MAG: NAD(P)-dependent oxidoreductase [Desulfuromonadales bacterium]|nr:NAD(P)-dependent oxidoreductase [Desulfuromonadales bacterium]